MNKVVLITIIFSFVYGDLLMPENGSILHHTHVLFEWEQIPNANSYEIQIAGDSEFLNVIVETQDNSLAYIEKINIDWNNNYYWRVRPVYNSGSGSWSNPYSFATGASLSSPTINNIHSSQVQSGITVFGAFFNYFSAALDQEGNEIWNSGGNNFVYYNTSKFGNVFGCYFL